MPVGFDVGETLEYAVGDGCARGSAVIVDAHEDDPRTVVARKVVGEGAHSLSDPLNRAVLPGRSPPERSLSLDQLGLEISHHQLEFRVRVRAPRVGCFAFSGHAAWSSAPNDSAQGYREANPGTASQTDRQVRAETMRVPTRAFGYASLPSQTTPSPSPSRMNG